MFQKIIAFLKEVRLEAKRVNWPSRQDTLKNTLLVLGFSVAVAVILGAFDFGFTQFIERFIVK